MKIFKRSRLVPAVIIALVGLVTVAAVKPAASLFEVSKNIDIFTSVYRELNTYYVDDIDPNTVMREGIDAMLGSLDPYTNYISEAEMEGHRFQMTGKYGGIGAVIRKVDGKIMVVDPYEGFAAHKSGLLAGDVLLSIDGKTTEGKNTDDISNILRGSPGTQVEMIVDRPYVGEQKIMLTREEIKVENVPFSGMVNDDIGYIRLTQFTENAGQNVADALRKLKEENTLNGVILDLRGNPGGLLREAVNVSNVFIPKGELVVSTMGKVKEWDRSFKTLNPGVDTEIPVIVLTSRSSASASEIVAGVIQDYDRGLVLGQRTFGKGLVQSTRDTPFKTKLKITTAKYYVPSGRCIQAIDYSSRNDDGSVGKIPDSLRTEFKTAAGRTVYDGGGVAPDDEVEHDSYARITATLIRKNHIFNYATKFRHENPSIAEAGDFEITENVWNDFTSYISDKDYSYTSKSEEMLDELKEVAEKEQYLESISESLDQMRDKVVEDKQTDIQDFRAEISNELSTEIVSRYHFQQGTIESSFSYDPDILRAIELFNNQNEYQALLQPE